MTYKSIKDIVDQVGISKTAIYNKLNKYSSFYEQFIQIVDGEKRINEEGIKALKENAHQKNKQKKAAEPKEETNSSEISRLLSIIEDLTESLKREQALHLDTKQKLNLLESGTDNTTDMKEIIIEDSTEKETRLEEEDKETKTSGKLSRIWKIIKE